MKDFKSVLEDAKQNRTLRKLSVDIGIGRSTLWRFATGKTRPSLDNAKKIAAYLNVTLSDVLSEFY